jgi:hypothetical protein
VLPLFWLFFVFFFSFRGRKDVPERTSARNSSRSIISSQYLIKWRCLIAIPPNIAQVMKLCYSPSHALRQTIARQQNKSKIV